MISFLEQFVNNFSKPKNWLVLANAFLVFFLIILSNLKVIPLGMGDFVFFSILALAFALWRPSWAFLFFCGTVPLESINLAPVSLGITIRPYQFIGAILIVAILARLASGRLNFKLVKLKIPDYVVIVLTLGGLLSAVFSPDRIASLKLEIILITFVGLYFLVRNYIQNIDDARRTVPFFLSSAAVVMLYGLWQNIVFLHNGNSFEVMLGRPNATFAEADWLGGYLVLVIALIYIMLYYCHSERSVAKSKNLLYDTTSNNKRQILRPASAVLRMTELGLYIFLTLSYILLILTVSRSAWLAAFATYVIFAWIFFTDLRFKNWQWKKTSFLKLKIISSLVVAIFFVYVFHLTNFQLGNRVQSTGTGLQKITVSCESDCGRDARSCVSTETVVQDISELENYGCEFINLEDVEKEKAAGRFVMEVSRPDPNVNVRAQIYQKSWQAIKDHPVLGIGWGSIGPVLGRDGRGAALNASNIFLETYLGAGILGFLALIFLFGFVISDSVKNYFYATQPLPKALHLFIIVGWFGVIVFNLFNAGMLLGFLWVWLAIAQIKS